MAVADARVTLSRDRPADSPQLLPPPAAVRLYSHARDRERLAYICRNVYGGTDDLPQRVASLHSQPGTHLLAACADERSGQLDALLCCQERGDVLWLFGARTAEELRGNGLAGLLLTEAEALARTLPGAAALLSITVPANCTMRRLFGRRGFRQQRRVVVWPETPAALAAHERMAGTAKHLEQQAEQQQAQQQQQQQREQELQHDVRQTRSFMHVLPAVAAVVDTPAAQALLPSWRQCTSAADLQAALLRLRQADPQRQQQHSAEGEEDGAAASLGAEEDSASRLTEITNGADATAQGTPAATCRPPNAAAVAAAGVAAAGVAAAAAGVGQVPAQLPGDSCAFQWVPGEYELFPAASPEVQQLVHQGAVWLLEGGPSCTAAGLASAGEAAASSAAAAPKADGAAHLAGTADAAVLVCFGPGFRGMRHAGIVAGSPAALESALLHASAVADPQCCRFYIDACGFDHPQLWASTGGPRTDILPFFRPLTA